MDTAIKSGSGTKNALSKFVLTIALVAVLAYAVSYLFAVSPVIVRAVGTLVSGG